MDEKRRILIVDGQAEWQNRLRQAFPDGDYDVEVAGDYYEAACSLDLHKVALIVLDPTVSAGREKAGDAGEVMSLPGILRNFPQLPVIIVTNAEGQARLSRTPDLPPDLPVIRKENWDRIAFTALVRQALSGEQWGPPAPEITPAPAVEHAQMPVPSYAGLTGPLSQRGLGLTGPLITGLVPPPVGSRPGKPRVLIVEENPEWQHTLAQLMDAEGYFWRVASSYDEAMERLGMESYHVVLLDLMLGGTETQEGKGWKLLDNLLATNPKTKVIVASGEASRSDVARLFMRYPIKGFIDKAAFHENELLSLVHEQLGGPALRIQMLGGFRIWRDGKLINNLGDERAETIIKVLLTRRGENVSVDELIECLWPGSEHKTVYAELGASINQARAALEPDMPRPNDSNFILRNGANYTFNFMANVEVDVEQLRHLVGEGRQHERSGDVDGALKDYEAARAIYLGDFLPGDRFAQWAIQERAAAQALYTDALNRMADLYADRGQLDRAIEAAARSLQVDAYIESTYRRLMRYHTCKGDRNTALSVYRTLVKLFSEFFGEEPGDVTQRLREDIEAGRPVVCVEASAVSGEWRIASER